jgi:hypothetical protein
MTKEEEVVCDVLQASLLAAMLCYQSPKKSYWTIWPSSIDV